MLENISVNPPPESLIQPPASSEPGSSTETNSDPPSRWGWLIRCALVGMAAVWLLILLGYLKFGSLATAWAYLDGERLMVQPAELHVNVNAGERKDVHFTVQNWTGKPIIIGAGSSNCFCASDISQLPVTIPNGGSVELTISVKLNRESCLFQQLTYYTNDPENATFTVMVRGHLLDL